MANKNQFPITSVAQVDWAKNVIHGTYYPHIDGMRCLAVLSVFLYHLKMSLCPAGFMGVDVFFVISGWLICGGILRDLERGSFTMISFYYRRIRRIFSAYFVLVVCVLFLGVGLYHWARIVPLAQTALFSTLFSTNLYFWLDMGYFQPNAHGNPLLNLWSLGVEEQFYITIPLLSLMIWKIRRSWVVPALFLGLIASLALCVVLGHRGDSTTAFYILPTRAWELLTGALLAVAPMAKVSRRGSWLSVVAIILIGLSFWCFSTAKTFGSGGTHVEMILPFVGSLGFFPFPGLVTLPLVCASGLLLRYGASGWVSRILRSTPFVNIGKISYSLYLWHWPIIVFVRYANYDRPPLIALIAIVALAFLAAYLSWRFIELPARVSKTFTPRLAFTYTAVGSTLLAALSVFLISSHGLRDVIRRTANSYASPPRPFMPNFKKLTTEPPFRPPAYPGIDPNYVERIGDVNQKSTFCLLGDSHAEAVAPGLDVVSAEHHQSGFFIKKSIHPYVDESRADLPQQLLKWVADRPDIHDVYLVGRWLHQYRVDDGLPKLGDRGKIAPVNLRSDIARAVEENFRRTALWFEKHGKRVFVFTDVPDYDYAPADIMARSQIFRIDSPIEVSRQDYQNRQQPISKILAKLQEENLLVVIPLGSTFLSGDHTVIMSPDGRPFYRDLDHLTAEGARHACEVIAPLLWPKQ